MSGKNPRSGLGKTSVEYIRMEKYYRGQGTVASPIGDIYGINLQLGFNPSVSVSTDALFTSTTAVIINLNLIKVSLRQIFQVLLNKSILHRFNYYSNYQLYRLNSRINAITMLTSVVTESALWYMTLKKNNKKISNNVKNLTHNSVLSW